MNLRFLSLLLALLQLVSFLRAEERPNILVIMTDDQGYDDFGFRNPDVFKTPALDQLRSESLEFTQFYVNPTCAPTRASLLTGRHFLETGVWGVHGGQDYLNLDETTFAERLKNAGYATAFYGKWHSGKTEGYLPWDRGFDVGELSHLYRHEGAMFYTQGGTVQTDEWSGRALARKASTYIKEHSESSGKQPFCLYLAMMATHGPWYAPDSRVDPYRKRGYSESLAIFAGMLEELDSNVGTVLQALEETGQAENTVVIFLTDNGPIFNSGRSDLPGHKGEDWERRNSSSLKGNKGTIYENGIRVPLFVRWPNRVEVGASAQVAHVVDIFPTLLSLAGDEPVAREGDAPLRGSTLLPTILHGEELPDRSLFIAVDHAQISGGRNRYDFLSDMSSISPELQPLALRKGDRKLVRKSGRLELYDIKNDPREVVNIARVEPEVAQRMSKEVLDTFVQIRDSGRAFKSPVFRVGSIPGRSSFVFACSPSAIRGAVEYSSHYTSGWSGVGDGQTHRIEVKSSGEYSVVVHMQGGQKGARLRVRIGDQIVSGRIVDGNRLPLGKLLLEEGKCELDISVESLSSTGGVLKRLKAVELIGRGTNSGALYGF